MFSLYSTNAIGIHLCWAINLSNYIVDVFIFRNELSPKQHEILQLLWSRPPTCHEQPVQTPTTTLTPCRPPNPQVPGPLPCTEPHARSEWKWGWDWNKDVFYDHYNHLNIFFLLFSGTNCLPNNMKYFNYCDPDLLRAMNNSSKHQQQSSPRSGHRTPKSPTHSRAQSPTPASNESGAELSVRINLDNVVKNIVL